LCPPYFWIGGRARGTKVPQYGGIRIEDRLCWITDGESRESRAEEKAPY
jgi:hypothetical protein